MPDVNFEYIKEMLINLTDKQSDMANRLSEMDTNLQKISQTVVGDSKFGQKGLVEQVQDLNKYVESDKKRTNMILGGLTVIGIGWSFFLKLFLKP